MSLIVDNMERLMAEADADTKTKARINDIASYLAKWGIKNVVLGLSGGIDSAFVFLLLKEARKQYPFEIHTMFFKHALHEHEADEQLVNQLIKPYAFNHEVMDISGIVSATNVLDGCDSAVVDTQYAYALMYTLLFRKAQQVGGVTFGTTNKDELGIGWFGKNSDMVVDVQPIHDFHKFELFQTYLTLDMPSAVLSAAPDGNLLTGKTDEEIFGCSYNEVSSIVDLIERGELKNRRDLNGYPKLADVITKNWHKLVKPRTEFNPVFL